MKTKPYLKLRKELQKTYQHLGELLSIVDHILKKEREEKKEMYCAIESCGEICEEFDAYCSKHGRSPHKIRIRES